jgi:hypothetical protein
LVLEGLTVDQPAAQADVWEKVIRKLRSGAMPPLNAPRPDQATVAQFVSSLEHAIDVAADGAPNPGPSVVHRLNRAEYANAVRDLLGLEIDGRGLLPADDASYGFDNVADVLSVSPALLDRYLLIAKKISRTAVGDPTIRPVTDTFKLPDTLVQSERMSEDLPFGSRGGLSIRDMFPVDGEYQIQLKLQRSSINFAYAIRGLDQERQVDLFLDGALVHEFVLPMVNRGEDAFNGDPQGNEIESKLHIRIPVKAGSHRIGIAIPRDQWYFEGISAGRTPAASDAYIYGIESGPTVGKIDLALNAVEVTGPFNPSATAADSASRRRIFVCRPSKADEEESCAGIILSTLARRAYRRAITPHDLARLMTFYRVGRQEGTFDRGIQVALERLLVSPSFLLRQEQDPPAAVHGRAVTVSDVDLASRLSFFLWSSLPDGQLLELAEQHRLTNPTVLQEQVSRMLRDRRSQALLSNFFGQWLYLRNLASQQPDPKQFPEFDENLREAFKEETALFLESQLREDRSALELVTAKYTFVNERLARFYGIPNVYGERFRRVSLPAAGPRAGLLGQGSILLVTSYPDRTSPVLRGKWLLENLLAAPPPPPPPNVPSFPDNVGGAAPKSVRARMELHRRNPVCASCHAKMDPFGFALENFDAIGRYRTVDAGVPVDASGTMPDGTVFTGPGDFRTALVQRREELMTGLTEKLLTYALGRGVEYYDMPAIRRIVREAGSRDYRWSSIIGSLVRSTPFYTRRAAS